MQTSEYVFLYENSRKGEEIPSKPHHSKSLGSSFKRGYNLELMCFWGLNLASLETTEDCYSQDAWVLPKQNLGNLRYFSIFLILLIANEIKSKHFSFGGYFIQRKCHVTFIFLWNMELSHALEITKICRGTWLEIPDYGCTLVTNIRDVYKKSTTFIKNRIQQNWTLAYTLLSSQIHHLMIVLEQKKIAMAVEDERYSSTQSGDK
ncbi:hypothetical protein ACJX0J_025924 [Zea mays]